MSAGCSNSVALQCAITPPLEELLADEELLELLEELALEEVLLEVFLPPSHPTTLAMMNIVLIYRDNIGRPGPSLDVSLSSCGQGEFHQNT